MHYRRMIIFMVVAVSIALAGTACADFSIGKTLIVNANDFTKDAVNLGGDVYVYGSVSGDAVALGGDVYIENGGVVKGDAVAVGGGITVRPNGYAGGDVVAIGGAISIEDGGTVEGEKIDLSNIPVPFAGIGAGHSLSGGLGSIGKLILFGPLFGALGMIGLAVFTVVLLIKILFQCAIAALSIWIAPGHVRAMAEYTRLEPLKVFLAGFVSVILIPFIVVILIVTILGIPFVPVFILLLFVAKLFGSVGIALWVGWFLPSADGRTDIHSSILGILALGLLRFVPIAGLLVRIVVGFMAIGAVVLTRFGARPARQV